MVFLGVCLGCWGLAFERAQKEEDDERSKGD